MNSKNPTRTLGLPRLGAVAIILLLAMATLVMPAMAHLGPEGSASSGAFTATSGIDVCRWEGNKDPCTPTMGVSGTYINYPENFYLDDIPPIIIPDFSGGIAGETKLFPRGYAAFGFMWCDVEVQGDGSAGNSLFDESDVDGGPGGLLPDGTWDDGGIGGACHLGDHYEIESYNTHGCGVGGTYAYAEDSVSQGRVWIGAACDTITSPGPVGLELCIYNEFVSGADAGELADCINDHFDPAGTGSYSCGVDGVMDVINYGTGDVGIPYPTSAAGCSNLVGSSAVFTYDYISLDNSCTGIVCPPAIVPATMGWIDSRFT